MTVEATAINPLLTLYDALVSVNVPGERARAVVDALEHEMISNLATKTDLATFGTRADLESLRRDMVTKVELEALRKEVATKAELEALRNEMATKAELEVLRHELTSALTIRLGGMLYAGLTLAVAALVLLD